MDQTTGKPRLSGRPGSCWLARAPQTRYPVLTGSAGCDVAIVGGGIVGLTTALALCEQGRSVALLEARRIGAQVTGRSTAKVTAQHALIYRHLIDSFGIDLALFYAEANRAAMQRIASWIAELGIACDFEAKAAYAYTHDPVRNTDIESEAEAARKVGFDARVLDRAPLPFETAGALCFPDQAQFNPASYAAGLGSAIEAAGGRIFEQSRVRNIENESRWKVETESGSVSAEHVVIATNITIKSPVGYANRTQPRSHAVMAFRLRDPAAINGMFIGIDDPTHSIRTGRDNEGALLITLGPKFDTGQDGNVASRFHDLEAWTRVNLPAGETVWRWCNEDYDTADRLPYVGQPDPEKSPGYFIATGFNAWGISNGTAAGLMIASEIAAGSHPWGALYAPTRPHPEDFHRNGDTQSLVASLDDISIGEGGVIERAGEKIAVWRDANGELHALSAACRHKGCTVTWNNADRTWDCPCHGSVYEADGAVIHGPAREPLPKRAL